MTAIKDFIGAGLGNDSVMARFEMQAHEPKKIQFELRVVMTLEEWKDVYQSITTANPYGPAGMLRDAISDMTEQAAKEFRAWPETKTGD